MIHPLRRRHRLLIILAAIISPLILYVALSGRSLAVTDTTPLVTRNIPLAGSVLIGERTLRLTQAAQAISMRATLFRDTSADAPWTLALADTDAQSPGPDILVYWQRSEVASRLSPDAVLLGPYLGQRENRFRMPVSRATGSVVLYSLAHNEVFGSMTLQSIAGGS